MNNLSLCASITKKLVACALLASPLMSTVAAQEAAEAVANEAINNKEDAASLAKANRITKQQKELEADSVIASAAKHFSAGDYANSIEAYNTAIDSYRKVSMTNGRVVLKTRAAEKKLATVYKAYAESLIADANKSFELNLYQDAEKMLDKALLYDKSFDMYVSNRKKSLIAKKKIAFRKKSIGAEEMDANYAALKEEKSWRLEQAQVLIANKRFSDAREILGEVLVLDPYDNNAANLLTRVNESLFLSGRSRRIATIQERLDEVEWKWNLPIHAPQVLESNNQLSDLGRIPIAAEGKGLSEKMLILIPSFKMEGSTIEEVLEKLKGMSRDLDPLGDGINIIYRPATQNNGAVADLEEPEEVDEFADEPEEGADDFGDEVIADDNGVGGGGKTYDFDFENMPLGTIIRYICKGAGLKYKIDTSAVIVADPSVIIDEMVTRFYPVSSAVFAQIQESGSSDEHAIIDDGIEDVGEKESVQQYLTAMGMKFAAGAKVNYIEGVSRLVVTNTVTEQLRVQKIIRELSTEASQVVVESKFVEINQTNIEEFGFQWRLLHTGTMNERINVNPNLSGQRVADDGRTGEFTTDRMNNGLPINSTGSISSASNQDGLSTGIRSITNLIPGGSQLESALGALSFTSIIGNNQFNTIVRALSQQENADVMSAPKVITQNGATAVIRVVEQRYFPESWDPPAVENIGGGGGTGAVATIQPSLPQFGDPRDLGIVLEVTPQIDADGMTIELEMKPSVSEFLGLEDRFNSPMIIPGAGETQNTINTGTTTHVTARYDMPIISTRSIDSRVKLWDGETVLLGGLIKERVIAVNDRIPFLSDIPLVGRLFQNKGEMHEKTNLLIFISARLVNTAGMPLRESEVRGLPDFKRL